MAHRLKWASSIATHLSGAASLLVAFSAVAANAPLTTGEDPVVLPAIGRMVIGFLITVAVACGVLYGLRRWLPKLTDRYSTASSRLSVQTIAQSGLKLHVVAIDGQTVLIAEGKNGIAMTALHPSTVVATPPT